MMRRVVTRAICDRSLPDGAKGEITAGWLHRAEMVLFDIVAGEDAETSTSDEWAILSLAMRGLQAQYHDQLDYLDYLREVSIIQRTIEIALQFGTDVDAAFNDAVGVTWSELAAMCFVTYASTIGSGGAPLTIDAFDPAGTVAMTRERLEAFFDLISVAYSDFQKHAAHPEVAVEGYAAYALSPLVYWPLVRRGDGQLVAPIAGDLLERATRSFVIDARKILSVAHQGTLNRARGEAYEEYVLALFNGAGGAGEAKRGSDIVPPGHKNCDIVFIEADAAVLTEVKSVRVRLITEMTKTKDELRAEFGKKDGLADGLVQINETALAIRQGRTKLRKRLVLHGLLVVHGEQILLNSDLVKAMLNELVKEKSGHDVIVTYQIVNDVGLESLARLAHSGESLGKFLYFKRRDPIVEQEDVHRAIGRYKVDLPAHPLADGLSQTLRNLVQACVPDWVPTDK